MVTIQDLEKLEFKNELNLFGGKMEWHIGEEITEFAGLKLTTPTVIYDIETQRATSIRGEFCVISRVCETDEEIVKFLEAVKFLFNIQ